MVISGIDDLRHTLTVASQKLLPASRIRNADRRDGKPSNVEQPQ
jgi:hypothetical protein